MITVRTEQFEGPFDLLFHLIEKHEIDIYDIPISLLADQYMSYLDDIKDAAADMETMSEFVRMAATLLEIKSKMLLPPPPKEEGEEEDPRAGLARRLLEYKQYKEVLAEFRAREEDAARVFYKGADKTVDAGESANQSPPVEEALSDVSAERLYALFLDVMNRRETIVDKVRADFGQIARDTFTIAQQSARLSETLAQCGQLRFETLFDAAATRMEKIVTFLALLELMKTRRVRVTQDGAFGAIIVSLAAG